MVIWIRQYTDGGFNYRLNSRAGVFALSLATWHGMRIVSPVGHFIASDY